MSLEYTSKEAIESKYRTVLNGFHSGVTQSLEFRKGQLRNLYYALIDNEEALKQSLYEDLHRSPYESELVELNQCMGEAVLAISKLDEWAKDEPLRGDLKFALSKVVARKSPYGVTLIIGPWNYPILCTVLPIISAIAAGNTVLLKPTEVAVSSTRVLTRVLESALDASVFQVVWGAVPETTALLNLRWDKIMVTGSNRVGKIVAHAAAEQLAPVALELGGKSPVIITSKANLKLSAKRLAWGKFLNAGQTCIAPDYILIERGVADKFTAYLREAIEAMYPALNSTSPDFAHIITDRLWQRASKLVSTSKGDVWQWGTPDEATRFFPPTVVRGVTAADCLMEEEIFAPILPIIEIDNAVSEAPAFIAADERDHPLSLYVFSEDQREIDSLLARTRSGSAMVNDSVQQGGSSVIPFGGVGASGTGRYHGKYGFDEFTHERPVVTQPSWIELALRGRYAPYKARDVATIRLVSRPLTVAFGRTGKVGRQGWISWFINVLLSKSGLAAIAIIAAVLLSRRV